MTEDEIVNAADGYCLAAIEDWKSLFDAISEAAVRACEEANSRGGPGIATVQVSNDPRLYPNGEEMVLALAHKRLYDDVNAGNLG